MDTDRPPGYRATDSELTGAPAHRDRLHEMTRTIIEAVEAVGWASD